VVETPARHRHRSPAQAADEAPSACKRFDAVLGYHSATIRILHHLTPIGVAMAGAETFDPDKD
jgi:tRNA-splicing ligase RtcB